VESSLIEVSELRYVGSRSMLTSFVSAESAEFEVGQHEVTQEASFLLATDGFWELFDVPELEALMEPLGRSAALGRKSPEDVADDLQKETLRRTPMDNATFILVAPDERGRGRTGRYPCVGGMSTFVRTQKEEVSRGADAVSLRPTR
jgi:serine/threonine protein phosphatase PrpC